MYFIKNMMDSKLYIYIYTQYLLIFELKYNSKYKALSSQLFYILLIFLIFIKEAIKGFH